MIRRAALAPALLALVACATPAAAPAPSAQPTGFPVQRGTLPPPPQNDATAASTPTSGQASAPAAVPAAPMLRGVVSPGPLRPTGDAAFDAWREDFVARAGPAWRPLIERELAGVTPDPRVVAADSRQPEFSRPIGAYVADAASATRIANGRRAMATVPQLDAISARSGVPKEILIAIWGMESAYGQIQGDYDIVRSMATLAAHGRRRSFAETQLYAALRMIAEGSVTRAQLKGSWAGGMGQTQFIPDTYLARAMDGDGDGRADIWRSRADALASAANLLQRAGWRSGRPWATEVSLPQGFDYTLVEDTTQPVSAWIERGVEKATGRRFDAAEQADEMRLILPAGARGPAFLVGANHDAIRAYNNSVSYALSIGFIADALQGRPPVQRAWPQDAPLSLADRREAQTLLTAAGFDTGGVDGVTGSNTRRALRAWQRANGRVPDGYLNGEALAALRRAAR